MLLGHTIPPLPTTPHEQIVQICPLKDTRLDKNNEGFAALTNKGRVFHIYMESEKTGSTTYWNWHWYEISLPPFNS